LAQLEAAVGQHRFGSLARGGKAFMRCNECGGELREVSIEERE